MKPILFNTEMVKAILDNRKCCTRRLVKNLSIHHEYIKESVYGPYDRYELYEMHNGEEDYESFYTGPIDDISHSQGVLDYAPYKVGNILYVRETFCPNYFDECIARNRNGNKNAYKADYNKDVVGDVVPEPKWHPSIHMPKEAARIFLKVTDVRVERLQDITEEQIVKEGLSPYDDICQDINWKPTYNDPDSGGDPNLKQGFEILWNTTIKEEWQEWKSNPYVWVIEFERCEKPEVAHED